MEPDLGRCDPSLLDLPERVVEALLESSPGLTADRVMLVGAGCRDVIHSALGHPSRLYVTQDLDVGVALADLVDYDAIIEPLQRSGDTGIRYLLGGVPTDVMPFGDVEDPVGVVAPRSRGEAMSVWAFREVFDGSMPLTLPSGVEIRIPPVEGYAALKLAAWLDRHDRGEYKDARDLAICLQWYAESTESESRLYESSEGSELLMRYELDVRQAAAHLLGADVAALIGPHRLRELEARWPGAGDTLVAELVGHPGIGFWPAESSARREVLRAMRSGWATGLAGSVDEA